MKLDGLKDIVTQDCLSINTLCTTYCLSPRKGKGDICNEKPPEAICGAEQCLYLGAEVPHGVKRWYLEPYHDGDHRDCEAGKQSLYRMRRVGTIRIGDAVHANEDNSQQD